MSEQLSTPESLTSNASLPQVPERRSHDPAVRQAPGSKASGRGVRGHIPELDGLRGIAILLVLAWHYWQWTGAVVQGGWLGVDLFFVLSGFLITGILLETRNKPGYFRNFYARRVLRIFPLYYGYLTLLFLSYWMFRTGPDASQMLETAGSPVWYYAYLTNFVTAFREPRIPLVLGHLWSLAVEEHFYLLFPLLVYRLSHRQLAYTLAGMIVLAIVVRFGLLLAVPEHPMAQHHLTPARMDTLALGALCAILARSRHADRVQAWSTILLILAAGCLLGLWMLTGGLRYEDVLMRTVGFSIAGVAFSLVLIGVLAKRDTRLTAPLRNPVLRYIGMVSYGIYVLHIFVGAVTRKALTLVGVPYTLGTGLSVLYTLLAIGAASVSWYLFEKRILRLKRYFESPAHP